MTDKKWKTYEEVAAFLLNQFSDELNLGKVEGKKIVPGASGTKWEIDGKGYSEDGSAFVIVECKRYTKSKVSQKIAASLAYQITDTGASGGILVTPIGYQPGAVKVSNSAKIETIKLNENSTKQEYILEFLNKICIGVIDTVNVTITETLSITKIDEDGNVEEVHNI